MLMLILQFQFTNTTDEEQDIIPDFCMWLCAILFSQINTKINRKKIGLRLDYILEKATWVNWNSDKYNLTVSEIMERIYDSLTYEQQRYNKWKIIINQNILIPYSNTSIDRLVRFINYGDNFQRATGMFTNLEKEYNHSKLHTLWNMYVLKELGTTSQAKIITKN